LFGSEQFVKSFFAQLVTAFDTVGD